MLEYPSFAYLIQFYRYIFAKKKLEFAVFFIITFGFSLLPYFVLWWEVGNLTDVQRRGFFGDGSVITLCSGILCSYFAILFSYKNEEEKLVNIIINLILVVLYFSLSYVFIKCQLNFDRSWSFITEIIILSGVVLFITLLSAMYLNFKEKVNLDDVQKYTDDVKAKKLEKEAFKKSTSKGGVKI